MTQKRRELLIVAAFSLSVSAPFWGKGFHVDEPFFLEEARGTVARPSTREEMIRDWPKINNNGPLVTWLLRAAVPLTGERERPLRAAFFPFDLGAALFLYLLFARFLQRPLLPALTVLACPAYLINAAHLMSEKLALFFAFAALWALVAGSEERKPRLFWLSAALTGAALLSKYLAVFLLPAAAAYLLSRGEPRKKVALWACAALALPAAYFAAKPEVLQGALIVSSRADAGLWASPSHRLRSFLAFLGGHAAAAIVPWLLSGGGKAPGAAALVGAALFLPGLDLAEVGALDRALGAVLAALGASALALLADRRALRAPGWALGAGWALAAAWIALSYWSIISRVVLFAVPPLVLLSALACERESRRGARVLQATGLAGSLALSLSLATVDYAYASAQRSAAVELLERYAGRRIWCAGHLGLHHYLLAGGALELDASRIDWSQLRPGDVIVGARTNAVFPEPPARLKARRAGLRVSHPLPLRLISGWGGEAGFYSNISGFLPYAFSQEPLEEFVVAEIP